MLALAQNGMPGARVRRPREQPPRQPPALLEDCEASYLLPVHRALHTHFPRLLNNPSETPFPPQ